MASPIGAVEATANALHPTVTRLAGWSFIAAENKTTIELRIGNAVGPLVGVVGLSTQSGSAATSFPPGSIDCDGGVWVNVLSGSITAGVLYSG